MKENATDVKCSNSLIVGVRCNYWNYNRLDSSLLSPHTRRGREALKFAKDKSSTGLFSHGLFDVSLAYENYPDVFGKEEPRGITGVNADQDPNYRDYLRMLHEAGLEVIGESYIKFKGDCKYDDEIAEWMIEGGLSSKDFLRFRVVSNLYIGKRIDPKEKNDPFFLGDITDLFSPWASIIIHLMPEIGMNAIDNLIDRLLIYSAKGRDLAKLNDGLLPINFTGEMTDGAPHAPYSLGIYPLTNVVMVRNSLRTIKENEEIENKRK